MSTYNYVTQAQALQQIANRCYDPTMTFWTQAELALYLNEALRVWNSLTSYWRGDFTFQSAIDATWYDLTQQPNSLRPYTVTDASLYTLMQYHLLEPPTGINPWPGSLQFSASDFLNAVQRRRDELLSLTGCTIAQSIIPAVAGRITLSDQIIDVRRMAYLPGLPLTGGSAYGSGPYTAGTYGGYQTLPATVMWPEDAWAEQSFNRQYTLAPAGTPFAYLMSAQPPISFDTDKPPAYAGQYELLTVNAGPALSAAAASTLLIPDDWTPVLKWGALADLLSREWDAQDLPRAKYCESRYRMGVAALLSAPALLAMRIGNAAVQIDSVRSADLYNTGWEGLAPGTPINIYTAGLNLLALSPSPDIGPYSFLATVVQNAPLPSSLSSPVQVSRDDLDVIIDYAQHIAAFKQGGQEFLQTLPLLQRFLKQAAVYNAKLLELGEFTSMLLNVSQMESGSNPVMQPAGEDAAGAGTGTNG
jgi:hypothetical protein